MVEQKRRIFSIKTVSAGVVAALLVLVFLSGTIYNFNLPAVTAALPKRGPLQQTELTTGIVQYAEEAALYAALGGTAAAILVREGETVRAGQPVIEMDFRGADADVQSCIDNADASFREQLDNLRLSRSRLQVDIERTETNIRNTERQIDELRRETFRSDTVSDFELRQTEADITQAEAHLAQIQLLFDAGAASRQELTTAENSLASLQNRRNNLLTVYREGVENRDERLAEQEESRDRQILNLRHQLELLHQERRTRSLETEALSLQEETMSRELQARLADYESQLSDYTRYAVLFAPADGVVTASPISRGQHIAVGQRLMTFGLDHAFIVECDVPLSNNFIIPGDTATLYNASHTLEGTVTQVIPEANSKRVTLAVAHDRINAGETFMIQFEKISEASFVLVPNGAVNRDGEGYFLNQIRRRRGVLGTEFFTERLSVYIGDSDSTHTAIIRGITFFEPIAVISDRPFTQGQTIRLQNEGDFFEN
ncbi:MAG: HlyD family efflux transporter periplasmic adaptor subunit [Firmicutes bacterium]|nr:HlyD family efflux transporter periplasmic adaptor subunit [Bacillota bacterium]